ncbi:MAG TPA: hypothetical protein VHS78_13260 [Candidatus Elarobacter sp.]|jgi:ATP/maltotriose-dependent transcriptional regulator MalT|nr:hypothetical protein [Candidatus Elarobacter sp.]
MMTPLLSEPFVPERLLARLDRARQAPVAVVLGEEGLGKSTLIAAYLGARSVAHVRFTAGPQHAHGGALLRGLAQAFAPLAPAMARSSREAARELERGGGNRLALRWAREHLARIAATVVLDDLHHVLGDARCTAFVCALIEATVPRVRWIVAVREASTLPLPRWLAAGTCGLPVEPHELRLRTDEIAAHARRAGIALGARAARTLREGTEGWPLAVRAALAGGWAGRSPSPDEIYDSLVDATLASCGPEDAAHLYELAAIGRFDERVLDALDCEAEFRALLGSCELVSIAQSGSGAFYEACRERVMRRLETLDGPRRETIVERAVGALIRVERWRDAIALRVAAGDAESIARTLAECGAAALEHGEVATVERALAALGDDPSALQPVMLALRAAVASLRENFDLADAWFGMALRDASAAELRSIVLRYGMELIRRGRPDAVDLLEREAAREAVRCSADEDAALWALLATAYVGVQAFERAREAAQRALRRLPAVIDETVRVRVLHQAAYVALADGDYGAAKRLAERALARAEEWDLYDLAARALSVIVNVAWLHDEDVAVARAALARLEEAGRKAGSDGLRLYAILNELAIEADAGDDAALARVTAELAELQVPMTRVVAEALLPAEALRAAWDGDFRHAYELLAPGAPKLADRLRAAYRWAEVALYGAAAGRRREALDALAASQERLTGVTPNQPLAIRALAYRALAEALLDDAASAACTLADARALAADAPARVRTLVAAAGALLACREHGEQPLHVLAVALEELERNALGGFARLLERLPAEAFEPVPMWQPAVLRAVG